MCGLMPVNKKIMMNEDFQNCPDDESTESAEKRRFESVGDALKAGKDEGAAKAREKGPQLKSGISDAVHDVAYGLAYGSVFAGAFLNELIPRSIRDGLSKGATAGKKAGQAACEKVGDALKTDSETVNEEGAVNPSFS